MKFSHIREFLTLADIGEFQNAANELSITQGTLSKHIKAMEGELGAFLFERGRQGSHLSEFGVMFLPYAKQLSELEDEYTKEFSKPAADARAMVIGLSPSSLQYEVLELLLRFKDTHRDIAVIFREEDSGLLRESVFNGTCDLAFIRENSRDEEPGLCKLPFVHDTLMAALPKEHPLAAYSAIALSQLQREEFYMLREISPVYQLCISECRKAGFEPNVVYTGMSGRVLMDLVSRGSGVSLTLKTPKRYYSSQSVAFVDIVPKAFSYIDLIHRRNDMSPGILEFIRFINPYLENA